LWGRNGTEKEEGLDFIKITKKKYYYTERIIQEHSFLKTV